MIGGACIDSPASARSEPRGLGKPSSPEDQRAVASPIAGSFSFLLAEIDGLAAIGAASRPFDRSVRQGCCCSTTGWGRRRCRCRTDPAAMRNVSTTNRPASDSPMIADSAVVRYRVPHRRHRYGTMKVRKAADPPEHAVPIFWSSSFSVGPVMSRRRCVFSMPTRSTSHRPVARPDLHQARGVQEVFGHPAVRHVQHRKLTSPAGRYKAVR